MAKTANELLQGILGVVTNIDRNMKAEKPPAGKVEAGKETGIKDALNISGALLKFAKVKPKTTKQFITFIKDVLKVANESDKGKSFKYFSEGMVSVSAALPDLVKGLSDLGKLRSRRVDKALGTMEKLWQLMYDLGDGRRARKVSRAIRLFHRLGRALRKISAPLRILSNFLTYLGLSFVVFAASMLAAGLILKLGTKMGGEKGGGLVLPVVAVVLGTIAVLVGALVLLTITKRFLKPGLRVIKGIGKGLLFLSLGILGFTLSLLLVASAMHAGLGFGGIMKALAILGGVILAIVGMFALLGLTGRVVRKGVLTTVLIGIGLTVMALAIGFLATTAAGISKIIGTPGKAEKVKFLGMEVSPLVRGLGMIGMIFIGAAALFALLGIPVVAGLVGLGVVVSLGISASLLLLAHSVKKLVEVSSKIPDTFSDNLELMISGLLQGVTGGISKGLTGKREKGASKLGAALKNTAILMGGIGILFTVSLTLSMFAKALTAFAQLHQMREITGYKKGTNEPIFGDRIDISKVSENIAVSISTFLTAIIQATTGLSKEQAGAIRKMGRALTGRRGILSAVIQFADVLKLYAQFGPKGEIGYAAFKRNAKGEIIYKANGDPEMIIKTVTIDQVATNIASSFSKFVEQLVSHTKDFEIGGKWKRQMNRLTVALVGKKGVLGREKYGLLEPISRFAETLGIYAKYGDKLEIPIFKADGTLDTSKGTNGYVKVEKIASNVVKTLGAFTGAIADKKIEGDTEKANKNLKKFSKVIDRTNKLAKALDGMSKLSVSVKELSTNIGLLADNLTKLETDKLEKLSTVSAAYLEKTNAFSGSNQRIMEKSTGAATRPGYTPPPVIGATTATTTYTPQVEKGPKPTTATYTPQVEKGPKPTTATYTAGIGKESKPVNWDEISQMIGNQVGSKVTAALKNGQFVFEFDTTKSGGIYYWRPA